MPARTGAVSTARTTPVQHGLRSLSKPHPKEQAEVEVKAERILSVLRLDLSLNLILLVSSLRRPRATVPVPLTVGQHLVRQCLPLLDRHEFRHPETKRE